MVEQKEATNCDVQEEQELPKAVEGAYKNLGTLVNIQEPGITETLSLYPPSEFNYFYPSFGNDFSPEDKKMLDICGSTYTCITGILRQADEDERERLLFLHGDNLKIATDKLKLTLRRLMEQGICFREMKVSRFDNLALGVWTSCNATEFAYSQIQRICGKDLVEKEFSRGDLFITNETWYKAIETVVLEHNPDAILDDGLASYARICKQHKEELQMFGVYFTICSGDFTGRKIAEKKLEEAASTPLPVSKKSTDKERKKVKQLSELKKQCDNFKRTNANYREKNKELNEQLNEVKRQHRKELLAIEHENADALKVAKQEAEFYKKQVELMQATIDSLVKPETEELSEEETAEPVLSRSSENIDKSLPELPDKRVLFLGGHPTLIAKLQKLHPDWTYVTDDKRNSASITSNFQVAFVYGSYLSHSLWYSFSAVCKEVPTVYLSQSKNITHLENEMRQAYQVKQTAA